MLVRERRDGRQEEKIFCGNQRHKRSTAQVFGARSSIGTTPIEPISVETVHRVEHDDCSRQLLDQAPQRSVVLLDFKLPCVEVVGRECVHGLECWAGSTEHPLTSGSRSFAAGEPIGAEGSGGSFSSDDQRSQMLFDKAEALKSEVVLRRKGGRRTAAWSRHGKCAHEISLNSPLAKPH